MDRATLALFIDNSLPGYRKEFKLSHWEQAIDNALLAYGSTDVDTLDIPANQQHKVRALALYFALELAERVAASRVNISVGNPPSSKAAGDAYVKIKALRVEQGRVCAALGVGVTTGDAMLLTSLPVRYLERSDATGGL